VEKPGNRRTLKTSPSSLGGRIGARTLLSSEGRAWRDVYVEVFTQDHIQHPVLVPAISEPVLSWTISGDAIVEERELDGEWISHSIQAGDFYLTHSNLPYEIRWQADKSKPFHAMHLYLSISLLERAAQMVLGKTGARMTLRDVSGGRDETISRFLTLIHHELASKAAASPLYVEGLLQSLAIHLVRNYASGGSHVRMRNTLPGHKLRHAVAFMASHLERPFDLGTLAKETAMSKFHFSRLFKKATGLTPSQYFIRQRIQRAQQLLRETDLSVIEIGLSVGYSNPSHFSQVFRRAVGVSPGDYRLA
jgi:AraC family transcriptional regulator